MQAEILQNSLKNTCARVSLLTKLQAEACNFIKKETLAQMFSREFCENSEDTFFTEHLRATVSAYTQKEIQKLFWKVLQSCSKHAHWIFRSIYSWQHSILLQKSPLQTSYFEFSKYFLNRYSIEHMWTV